MVSVIVWFCGSVVPRFSGLGFAHERRKEKGIVMLHMCLQVCYVVSAYYFLGLCLVVEQC